MTQPALDCSKIIELAKLDLSEKAHMDVMSLFGHLTPNPWCNMFVIIAQHNDNASLVKMLDYMWDNLPKEKIADAFTKACVIKAKALGEMVFVLDQPIRSKIALLLNEEVEEDKKQQILNNSPHLKGLLLEKAITQEVEGLKNKKSSSNLLSSTKKM